MRSTVTKEVRGQVKLCFISLSFIIEPSCIIELLPTRTQATIDRSHIWLERIVGCLVGERKHLVLGGLCETY